MESFPRFLVLLVSELRYQLSHLGHTFASVQQARVLNIELSTLEVSGKAILRGG